MTRDVISCYEDEDVEEAERLMQARQVRRVLVLNPDARLVGIVALGDLAAETGDPYRAGQSSRMSPSQSCPGADVC
jgi:CBS-domain-containing membrane protein